MTRAWLLAAMLSVACSNAAHEEQVRLRGICQGFVPGTTTFSQASQSFSGASPTLVACRSDYKAIGGDDQCPHDGVTSVCDYAFEFLTTDCSGPLSGGGTCATVCEVRSVGQATQSTAMCARQWVTNVIPF